MSDVSKFYDDYVESQVSKGVNDRIYTLYKKTLKFGLKKNSSVLELGCGIGALTYLLAKHASSGYVEAMDVSEKSIEFAKNNIKSLHVKFNTGDAVKYIPDYKETFDFITLFDVLEHIPSEQHFDLFANVYKLINQQSLLLINIPNPLYKEYDILHQPEQLQIIDQPLYLDELSKSIYSSNLQIRSVETYSISVKDDYQFIVVQRRYDFKEIYLSKERNLLEKINVGCKYLLRRLLHRYP